MIKLKDSIMSYKKPTTSNHSILGFQLLKTYMYTPLKILLSQTIKSWLGTGIAIFNNTCISYICYINIHKY